jgi:glycerol kinase
MEADAHLRLKELRVDGGACANNLLMQIQADLLQAPVVRPQVVETTARGAAYLAGLAVGYWKSQAEIARQWRAARTFASTMESSDRRRLVAGWVRALDRAKGWVPK